MSKKKPEEVLPKAAVVGASGDKEKMGNKAVRAYLDQGYEVLPVNPKGGQIEGLDVVTDLASLPRDLEILTLYVPPKVGMGMLPKIAELKPKALYVNPGADSPELIERAYDLGLDPIVACSITSLGLDPSAL